MAIEVRLVQNDRSARIEIVNSTSAVIDPNFSLQVSANLSGASYASTSVSGSGAVSTTVSNVGGNLSVNTSGNAIGTFDPGEALIIIALDVSAAGALVVDSASGTINGADVSAETLPGLSLVAPSLEVADFIEGEFAVGGTLSLDVDSLPEWNDFLSRITDVTWLRNGVEIAGATNQKYTLTESDVAAEITAIVEYRDGSFNDRIVKDDVGETELAASVLSGRLLSPEGKGLANSDLTFTYDGAEILESTDSQGGFTFSLPAGASGRLYANREYTEGDPSITVSDALDVLRLAVGLDPSWGPAEGIHFVAADLDQDGRVTVSDALDTLRAAVGLESEAAPRWIGFDADVDFSGYAEHSIDLMAGVDIASITDPQNVEMTAILLGNMEEYV